MGSGRAGQGVSLGPAPCGCQTTDAEVPLDASRKRRTALVLLVLWTGWWVVLGVTGMRAGGGLAAPPTEALLPAAFCLLGTLVAWRSPWLGGALALLVSLVAFVSYPFMLAGHLLVPTDFFLTTTALPPLVAGNLLLFDWSAARKGLAANRAPDS